MISLDLNFNILTRDLSHYLENQVKVGLFGSGVGLSLVLGFSAAYTCYYLISVAKVRGRERETGYFLHRRANLTKETSPIDYHHHHRWSASHPASQPAQLLMEVSIILHLSTGEPQRLYMCGGAQAAGLTYPTLNYNVLHDLSLLSGPNVRGSRVLKRKIKMSCAGRLL